MQKLTHKYIFLILMFCICIFELHEVSAKDTSKKDINIFEGTGSEENPYIIDSLKKFIDLKEQVNSGIDYSGMYFLQTDDLNLKEISAFEPIGNENYGFAGIYNGNGYVIDNLKIKEDGPAALFLNMNGVISNLGIKSGEIIGKNASGFVLGGKGSVYNCYNKAAISAEKASSGIADNIENIFNCINIGTVTGQVTSGIASYSVKTIRYSYSNQQCTSDSFNGEIIDSSVLNEDIDNMFIEEMNYHSRLFAARGDQNLFKAVKWQQKNGEIGFAAEEEVFFDGRGTLTNPFLISKEEDFILLADLVNSGINFQSIYFVQQVDVFLEDKTWVPIGAHENTVFEGIYNGRGHVIAGIETANAELAGIFGNFNGKLLNLGIDSGHMNGITAGSLVAVAGDNAKIVNCYSRAYVNGQKGQLCAQNSGEIRNCLDDKSELAKDVMVARLNSGLWELVVNTGEHGEDLFTWSDDINGNIVFGGKYEEKYWDTKDKELKGEGTKYNPYKIKSVNDLIYLREKVYSGNSFYQVYFKQTNDIDLKEQENWVPIAEVGAGETFSGIYDGAGYVIKNIMLNRPIYGGLFGNVSGSIKNLGIESGEIRGEYSAAIAAVVENRGRIVNSYSKIGSEESANTSSLTGILNGSVINCFTLTSDKSLSVGFAINGLGKIENSYSSNALLYGSQYTGSVINSNNEDKFSLISTNLNKNLIDSADKAKTDVGYLYTWSNSEDTLFSHIWKWNFANIFRYFLYYLDKLFIIKIMVIFICFWIIVAVVRIKKYRSEIFRKFRRSIKRSNKEYLLILSILILFCDTFIYYKGIGYFKWIQWFYLTLIHCIWGYFLISSLKVRNKVNFIEKIKHYKALLIFMVIVCIMVVSQMHLFPMFDSNLYYGEFIKNIDGFKLTVSSFLSAFNVWGTPLQGGALFMSIGECLYPGTAQGVYVVNLILLLAAMGCCYSILRILYGRLTKGIAAVLAFTFAVLPCMAGLTEYINPDFYAAVFFVYLVFCYVKKYNVLFGFCAFLFLFTKANMLLTYAVFLGCVLIYELFRYHGTVFQRLIYLFHKKPLFYWTLPVYLYLWVKFVTALKDHASSHSDIIISYAQHILNRFGQFFVFGFRWVIWGIALITLISMLIRKKVQIRGIIQTERDAVLGAVLLASFIQLGALCVIRNSLCPRYMAFSNLSLILVFAACVEGLYRYVKRKRILVGLMAGLMSIQLFYTIDPLLIAWGNTYELENKTLYSLCNVDYKFSDVFVYNYEYGVSQKLVDEMLSRLELREKTNFYVNGDAEKLVLTGNSLYPIYWDYTRGKRSYVNGEHSVNIKSSSLVMTDLKETSYTYRHLEDSIYLVETDFLDAAIKEELKILGYQIKETVQVKNRYTSLTCYIMER